MAKLEKQTMMMYPQLAVEKAIELEEILGLTCHHLRRYQQCDRPVSELRLNSIPYLSYSSFTAIRVLVVLFRLTPRSASFATLR